MLIVLLILYVILYWKQYLMSTRKSNDGTTEVEKARLEETEAAMRWTEKNRVN